jgi:hypothetical protein
MPKEFSHGVGSDLPNGLHSKSQPPPKPRINGKDSHLLAAALSYAARGWLVLPLFGIQNGACSCQKGKACSHPGKHPRIKGGVKEASQNPDTITAWWKQYPFANIGLAMGSPSGVIALDVDGEEGRASLSALTKQHGPLPPTLRAKTGGGEHLYFRDPNTSLPNRVRFAPGLDTRSLGGYVVAPPSLHVSGAPYLWLSSPTLEPAELPSWLLELITLPKSSSPPQPQSQNEQTPLKTRSIRYDETYWQRALEGEAQAVASAKEGERTNCLRDAALKLGSLIARGDKGDPKESDIPCITKTLLDAAQKNGSSQKYEPDELLRTIERGIAKGKSSPRPK